MLAIGLRVAVLATCVSGTAGCATASSGAGVGADQAISAQASRFSRAFEHGNAGTLAGLYTGDAVLYPPGRPPIRGRGDIREFWGGRSPDFHVLEHRLTPNRLDVYGDVAVDEGVWTNTTRWRDDPPETSSGVYLVVWRKGADGEWRMQYDMWQAPLPPAPDTVRQGLAIRNVNVLPMSADTALEGQTVLIRDGRIIQVAPSGRFHLTQDVEVIDGTDRYLMPGLVDAHVHLRATSELDLYLRSGVTTVLNMRGTPQHLELARDIDAGRIKGPRIITAGPLLDGDPPIWGGSATRVVRTAEEAKSVVAHHDSVGYHIVKTYNNLDPAVLAAVVTAAHDAGLPVVSHLPRRPVREQGLRTGLRAGVDVIAHGEEVFFTHFGGAPDSLIRAGRFSLPTDDEIREAAQLIQASGAAVIPNLSFIEMTARMIEDLDDVYGYPEFRQLDPEVQQMWRQQNPLRGRDMGPFEARERAKRNVVRRLTAALNDLGVALLIGTDASAPGMYPGRATHLELEQLVAAGLTPFEALVSGTRVPGHFLAERVSRALRIGVVAPGYIADLVLLEGDPRLNLEWAATPLVVIRDGQVAWTRQ